VCPSAEAALSAMQGKPLLQLVPKAR
jgi:hypothetical protein